MYHKIAWWMVGKLHRWNPALDDKDAQEICAYGIEITLSTMMNFVLLLVIGALTHTLIPAVLFGMIFAVIRLYIGGYHCTGYWQCNLTFCGIYLLVILLGKLLTPYCGIDYEILILMWCGLGIWYLGPVENSHKPTTEAQRKQCHTIAKGIFLADCAIAIGCYLIEPFYGVVAALTLLSVVALLPIGTLSERRRRYEAEKQAGTEPDCLCNKHCS